MSTNEQLSKLLSATFPLKPMPARFFWNEGTLNTDDDFSEDLLHWLDKRQWTEIRINDWAMIGNVSVVRERLEPTTFLYYLPSLLLGASQESKYLDWALEAIIPSGRDRRPKSRWWNELLDAISLDQIDALRSFLAQVRIELLQPNKSQFVISTVEVLTGEAEMFWNVQARSSEHRTRR